MIRVQMRQDYCVWDQTARPQETAQGAVSFSRIKDIHFVLIPEDRRVSIPGTELDVFRGRMMDGKKGYNDNRRSDEQQESPKTQPKADKTAETGKKKHYTGDRQDIGRMNPKGQTWKGTQMTDTAQEKGSERRQRTGQKTGKKGERETKKGQPEKQNQNT